MHETRADEGQRNGSAVVGSVTCNGTSTGFTEAEAIAFATDQFGVNEDLEQAWHIGDWTAATLPNREASMF
jgi:hypothetical protein